MIPTDQVVLTPKMILPVDLCSWLCMGKDWYRNSELLNEYLWKEVYIVVILLGESANWLRYHHGHLNQ